MLADCHSDFWQELAFVPEAGLGGIGDALGGEGLDRLLLFGVHEELAVEHLGDLLPHGHSWPCRGQQVYRWVVEPKERV